MHDPGAGLDRPLVVAEVHRVDELGLTRQVGVVGARLGACRDQTGAVLDVRPDGGDDHPGLLRHRAQRSVVVSVGVEQRQVGQRGVERREPFADRLELGPVASGQRPAAAVGHVAGEVLGGQASGEAGRAEEHEVIGRVGLGGCAQVVGHGVMLPPRRARVTHG